MGQSSSKEQQQCRCANERRDGPVLDPASSHSEGPLSATIALGGGCFWGIEYYMTKNFQNRFPKSVKTHSVGFMNPDHSASESTTVNKPISYQEVCQGKSGYVEVLLLELYDAQTHFEDVIRFFFSMHDPTTVNRQGADRGTQYSSIIFCADQGQKSIVLKVMEELGHLLSCSGGVIQCYERKVLQTKVVDISPFTEATERHQGYLSKNPKGYCNHFVRSRDRRPPQTYRRFNLRMPTAFLPT